MGGAIRGTGFVRTTEAPHAVGMINQNNQKHDIKFGMPMTEQPFLHRRIIARKPDPKFAGAEELTLECEHILWSALHSRAETVACAVCLHEWLKRQKEQDNEHS